MNKVTKIALGIIIIIVVVWIGYSLSNKESVSNESIKIGAILPMTGDAAKYGTWIKNGMELAIEEINNNGGINDKKVVLDIQDSKTNTTDGVNAFQYIIQTESPVVVMTTLTSVCKAIIPISEKNEIILFANSTFPGITENQQYVFRNIASLSSDIPVAVDYISNKLDQPDVAIIWRNDDFGSWANQEFSRLYKDNGGEVVGSESYSSDNRDFRTILTKIALKDPGLVYLLGYSEIGLITKQAVELGYNWNYFGITTMSDPETIKLAGGTLEGAIHTEPASALSSDSGYVVAYRNKYQERYSEEPEVWGATFYDAVKIFALAADGSDISSGSIKNNLLKIQSYKGVSGETSFLPNGDVQKPVNFYQIKDGQSILLE